MDKFSIDKDTKIGQIHLNVSNIDQSIQFYESFLGLKLIEKTPQIVFLSTDGKHPHLIALSKAKSNESSKKMAGLYHFAILLPNRKDLGSFLKYLLKHKDEIKIDGFADHLVSEAVYIRDPDNIGIEIYRDKLPTEWKWNDDQIRMGVKPLDVNGLLAESNSWIGFPTKTMIGHIHLHVSNLAKAKTFYSEILGFTNTATIQGALFFAAGKYHHHIAANIWLGENISNASREGIGLDYFTINFSNKEKLNSLINRLKSHNITVQELEDNSFNIFDEDKIIIRLIVS
jgi:catechol 2,3-dioxygenase